MLISYFVFEPDCTLKLIFLSLHLVRFVCNTLTLYASTLLICLSVFSALLVFYKGWPGQKRARRHTEVHTVWLRCYPVTHCIITYNLRPTDWQFVGMLFEQTGSSGRLTFRSWRKQTLQICSALEILNQELRGTSGSYFLSLYLHLKKVLSFLNSGKHKK